MRQVRVVYKVRIAGEPVQSHADGSSVSRVRAVALSVPRHRPTDRTFPNLEVPMSKTVAALLRRFQTTSAST